MKDIIFSSFYVNNLGYHLGLKKYFVMIYLLYRIRYQRDLPTVHCKPILSLKYKYIYKFELYICFQYFKNGKCLKLSLLYRFFGIMNVLVFYFLNLILKIWFWNYKVHFGNVYFFSRIMSFLNWLYNCRVKFLKWN